MQWHPTIGISPETADQCPIQNKIVVGFDTRFLSDRFAGEVARVLAANGFTVLLANPMRPRRPFPIAVKESMCHRGRDDHRLAQCAAL